MTTNHDLLFGARGDESDPQLQMVKVVRSSVFQ